MLCYDYETIRKLVQPLMEMMKMEFPNDCELVIDANSAQIIFKHSYLTFFERGFEREAERGRRRICEKNCRDVRKYR